MVVDVGHGRGFDGRQRNSVGDHRSREELPPSQGPIPQGSAMSRPGSPKSKPLPYSVPVGTSRLA